MKLHICTNRDCLHAPMRATALRIRLVKTSIASKNRRSATHSWDNKSRLSVFLTICGRVFAPRSRFGVAAGAATRAQRRARFSATAPLRDCDWRLRAIMVDARCEGLFCKGSPRPIPRKRKRPVRTSGPKRELEARRGTGPHTRRGCTVLDLGRCTGTYCFGVAGKLGRGPRVCKAKV